MRAEKVDVSSSCSVCNDCEADASGDRVLDLRNKKLIKVLVGMLLFIMALILSFPNQIYIALILSSYLITGGEVILKAFKNIASGRVFDENFLMTIATLGAFAIGEYPEAAAVMLFYQAGVLFESGAVNRSKRSIQNLMEIRPEYANLKTKAGYKKVNPEQVKPGDIIRVQPGEKVPLDGKVIEGSSTVDTSILTGESYPAKINAGDEILSGYVNNNGLLTVEVTNEFDRSAVSRVLDLIQKAAENKAPTEKFITKFARYYTPVVVGAAIVIAFIPPMLLTGASLSEWVYRALVFLVISCPCALVVSIPIGFVGGIGKASRNGILIKGSNYLEALNDIDSVIFDKTGTITEGKFKVNEIYPVNGFDRERILQLAAMAESASTHPIAQTFKKAYEKYLGEGKEFNNAFDSEYESYKELAGLGVKTTLKDGHKILVGNEKLLTLEGINIDKVLKKEEEVSGRSLGGTTIHLAVDNEYAGFFRVSDKLKDESQETIKQLRNIGIKNIAILTGDNEDVAWEYARKLDIDQVYARLLPEDKLSKLEEIYSQLESRLKRKKKGKIMYVGDGINDAPALARVDVGVAMGGIGSDAAVKSSDIVLMTDEPGKIVKAIEIAKETKRIVWQNIGLTMGVKGVVLLLGAIGLASIWQAVIADVGVMLLAAINSFRLSFS